MARIPLGIRSRRFLALTHNTLIKNAVPCLSALVSGFMRKWFNSSERLKKLRLAVPFLGT